MVNNKQKKISNKERVFTGKGNIFVESRDLIEKLSPKYIPRRITTVKTRDKNIQKIIKKLK